MPASEQTWRDQKQLHAIFAVTSVVMLIATVWMFAVDHARPWKPHQKTARTIDRVNNAWRKIQFQSEDFTSRINRLTASLEIARGGGVDRQLVDAFKAELVRHADEDFEKKQRAPNLQRIDALYTDLMGPAKPDAGEAEGAAIKARAARAAHSNHLLEIDKLKTQLDDSKTKLETAEQNLAKAKAGVTAAESGDDAAKSAAAQAVAAAQQEVDNLIAAGDALNVELAGKNGETQDLLDAAIKSEKTSATARAALFVELDRLLKYARDNEDIALRERKMKSSNLDKAKADRGLGVRDEVTGNALKGRQRDIDRVGQVFSKADLRWQTLSLHRKALQVIRDQMDVGEKDIQKRIDEAKTDLRRLETTLVEQRSNYLEWYGYLPLPGKKWLEAPILEAFNSPLKIDNLWHEGLEQDFNHRKVRRFDRCTTCHQLIDKTMPGAPTEQGYVRERLVQLNLSAAREEGVSAGDLLGDNENDVEQALDKYFGVKFAPEGLLDPSELTVAFVTPYSRAAQASLVNRIDDSVPGLAARRLPLMPGSKITPGKYDKPGLELGDVIVEINGDPLDSRAKALHRLLDAAADGATLQLTIRRGLPHPYVAHPRLDLFVGSLSPHPMAVFACTVCHDGQGSATEFKWASHTPDSPQDRADWIGKYKWFDNHHWIYPQLPKRFMESGCLKCHHDVTELAASRKFPEAPAPKLTRGHQLISKYGCYGCHEINGHDAGERVGPDLRTEPNFFAAAQQLKVDSGFGLLEPHERRWIDELIDDPTRDETRREILQMIEQDKVAAPSRLSDDAHDRLAPLLKDVDSPGLLRKAGPSLRFVKNKLDPAFLFDWIRQPSHFRPTSRMPQFFGQWNHIDGQSLADSKRLEPLETYAMAAYLQMRSQPFEFIEPEKDVAPPDAKRGAWEFQIRCVACHTHKDFPDAAEYRDPVKVQQAPDLSNLTAKFSADRNPNGRKWLYTWLKNPKRYHARTSMPNMVLDPVEQRDAKGAVTATTDPAADIVEYLLSQETSYQPKADTIVSLSEEQADVLDELLVLHLQDGFFVKTAQDYATRGIPEAERASLKGAEKELLVPDADYEANKELTPEKKLLYVGRKSIAKFGCYGCHDIPGFEEAKPIGTGLADWGLKEPSKLAFEHIHNYLHGHGAEHDGTHAETTDEHDGEGIHPNEVPPFYNLQLNAGNRIGFIYQKLTAPRSYDFEKTANKKYNERLRMPLFPFDEGEREAVITFVLGLVADPPTAKYVFTPNARTKAILEGQRVLDKFNCAGCHVLEGERWDIAFENKPEQPIYGPQPAKANLSFVMDRFLPADIAKSATPDRRDKLSASLYGMPTLGPDGLPTLFDDQGDDVVEEDKYRPFTLDYNLDLWKSTLVGGNAYQVGVLPITAPAGRIEKRIASYGGDLAKYLLSHVVQKEKQANPNAKGSEAWAWLPPPLVGQGAKVQTDWLHNFLLDPHAIRPAVFMRMPKFNLSPDEASKLVNYFAARDNVEYPYSYSRRRRDNHLAEAEAAYQAKLKAAGRPGTRFGDAVQIVVNPNYCVKCHIVGDFSPTSSQRAMGPDLSRVYQRLRPDYLRRWIGKPNSILPYTAMPVNVPYDPSKPNTGTTVPQDLYHGNSQEQIDALVDLLMNYDKYAQSRSLIAPLVKESAAKNPLTTPPAGEAKAPGAQ